MDPAARFNPFPGLRSFEPDEDHLFFGRERQVDDLLGRLRRTRFLGVVGGSGSGKSSLVKSGLIPSLHSGFMVKAGSSWRVALLRPGSDPIHNLSIALNDPGVLGGDTAMAELEGALLDASLRRSGHGLVDAVHQAHIPAGDNVLIIVDQFEELFRFKQVRADGGGRDEAVGFVKLLLEAARQDDLPIYVVLTMRSEFIGSCAELPGLAEAVNEGQYLVPRMTRDELRLAITGPVAVGGGEIAPRLVTRVLNEVGDDPDQLPVLQHALMRTWDFWASHHAGRLPIDFDDYVAIGTMKDALSRHADEAYDELETAGDRRLAELLFKALTDTTGQGIGLRRPSRVQELCDIAEASHDEMAAVVDRFRIPGRTFLVPSIAIPLAPSTVVDLSHESLMRLWTRLITWTEEEARSSRIYRRLSAGAGLHARNEAGLWRDPELQLAVNWRDTQRPTVAWARRYDTEFERATEFLSASQQARDAEAAKQAAEAAERRRQERTLRHRTYALFVISLLGIIVVGVLLRMASRDRAEASEALVRVNKANNLAIIATEDFREKPAEIGATGLMAIEALRLAPEATSVRHTLTDILQLLPPHRVSPVKQGHTRRIVRMAVDPAGRIMVTAGLDRKLVVWDFAKHEMLRTLEDTLHSQAQLLAISGDGRWVVAASPLELHVWESETGKEVKQIKLTSAQSIAFSPTRPVLAIAVGERDGAESNKLRYKEFSTTDWSEIPLNDAPPALEVAFSGEGDLVLVTTEGIRLAAQKKELPNTRGCRSVRFDAAGGFVSMCPEGLSTFRIADGSSQRLRVDRSMSRELSALSVTSFEGRHPRDLYLAHSASSGVVSAFDEDGAEYLRLPEPVTSMAVPSSGAWMASGNAAGEVAFWRLARGLAPPPLAYLGKAYRGIVTDLTFSHDEELLVLTQPDGWIRIFETATGKQIHEVQLNAKPRRPQFSPDDSVLAVLYADDLRLIRTPKGTAGGSNRTQEWSILDADLKARKAQPRLSFSFSLDSDSLIIAEGDHVKRYRLSPTRTSLTALPPIVLKSEEDDVIVSADREWLAVVDADGAQPARTSFWNVATGMLTTPETNAQLRAAAPSDVALPKWIKLRPADEANLSGDATGGDWWTVDLATLNSPILKITERVTGHPVAELEHPSDVNALAISSDGNWIAAVTREDQAVFLWPWSREGLIALACGLVPGNLTPETWKERHLEELGLGPHRPTCP